MCEDPEPRGPRDVKREKMEDIFMVQKIRGDPWQGKSPRHKLVPIRELLLGSGSN